MVTTPKGPDCFCRTVGKWMNLFGSQVFKNVKTFPFLHFLVIDNPLIPQLILEMLVFTGQWPSGTACAEKKHF